MQNKVNLTDADRVVNSGLIRRLDLFDLYDLAFLCSFTEWFKNGGFLLNTHIAVVSSIMVAGNCLKTMITILCNQTRY